MVRALIEEPSPLVFPRSCTGFVVSPDEVIARIARKQHGVFTRAQAHRAGLSDGAIRRRLESGRWLSIHRGVYVVAGIAPTREQEMIAAVLACGRLAAVSHSDAAALLRLIPKATGPVHVVLPHGQHRESRSGLIVHQARLTGSDVRRVGVIPATCPNRTLVDVASILTPKRLESCVDEAILSGLTTAERLSRYIKDRRLARNRGVGILSAIVADRSGGALQKELERMFVRKIKRSRLPMPRRQYPEGRRKIDFAYPDAMIAVELDGKDPHSTGAIFRDDRRRQNELVLAGWYPLRFTWTDVDDDWSSVEATLEALLKRRTGVA